MHRSPIFNPHLATPRRQGFTIVELLVVITIVSVLVAVLLPSLKKARDTAQLVSCLSNDRQMGVPLHSYTFDNKLVLPWFYNGANPGCSTIQTQGAVGNTPNLGPMGMGILKADGYLDIPTKGGIFRDPGRDSHANMVHATDYGISWYSPVPLFTGASWPSGAEWQANGWAPTTEKLVRFWPRYPSIGGVLKGMNIMVACYYGQYEAPPGTPKGNEIPHGDGTGAANVLLIDGSAKTISDAFNPYNTGGNTPYNERPYSGNHAYWWAWAHNQVPKIAWQE